MDWKPATEAPEDVVVMTKIDDADGVRNKTALLRSGYLWWHPDKSMYVYYRPTHFRLLNEEKKKAERARVEKAFVAAGEARYRSLEAIR